MIDRLTLIGSLGAAAPLPGSNARALLAALARGRWSGKFS